MPFVSRVPPLRAPAQAPPPGGRAATYLAYRALVPIRDRAAQPLQLLGAGSGRGCNSHGKPADAASGRKEAAFS